MRQGFEIALEGETPLLEEFDIRLAVGQEFLLEIELYPHAPLGRRTTAQSLGGLGRSCCRASRRPWVAGAPRSAGWPGF